MSHIIGRGRYARESYPQSPTAGGGGGLPNVLTLQPGGSAAPPNQFIDWNSLYTEFLKTKGPVRISFDSTFVPSGKVTLPLATYDIQGRALWSTSGLNPNGGTEVEIRQIVEPEDFGAEFTPEAREQEARLMKEIASRK